MVAKRGIIRIIEASIAILIIAGVILLLMNNAQKSEEPDLSKFIFPILDEISRDSALRDKIVDRTAQSKQLVDDMVKDRLKNLNVDSSIRICEVDELCNLEEYPATSNNIYSSERIISSTLYSFNPVKIKIFLWNK